MKIGFIGQGWIGKNYADNFEARGYEVVRYSLEPEYAGNQEKIKDCEKSVKALFNLLDKGIRARDIMTKKAFENAITMVLALGGSTNAVLHLLSLAHEADVELTIDAIRLMGTYDTAVLFSGDGDFAALCKYLRDHGKRVIIISYRDHVSYELINDSDLYISLDKFEKELKYSK